MDRPYLIETMFIPIDYNLLIKKVRNHFKVNMELSPLAHTPTPTVARPLLYGRSRGRGLAQKLAMRMILYAYSFHG